MARATTNDKILAAALAVFSERGYESATVQEIRLRAGISNGSLFHFFRTKQDIAGALFVMGMANYQHGLSETLRRHQTDAEQGIRAAVRYHLRWTETRRHLALFVFDRGLLDWSATYLPVVEAANDSLREQVSRWAQPFMDTDSLKTMFPGVFLACLIGPAQAVCRLWLSGKRRALPSRESPTLEDAAWMALGETRIAHAEPEAYPAVADAAWIAGSWMQ